MKNNLAWHFVGSKLRDGSPVPADGVWLEHKGPLVLCEYGLHWSRTPFDALQYAPGETLCLVEIGGTIVAPENEDKGISSLRKIVVRMDATELLRYFARMQALSVIHLNDDLPEIVSDYIMTGDEGIRDAARAAAWAAERAAERDAASAAAIAAAWAAARDAERAAANAAASAAAIAAARAAAKDAAWAAAMDAAWAAARAAASAAERDAAWAAEKEHFNDLVYECFEEWL